MESCVRTRCKKRPATLQIQNSRSAFRRLGFGGAVLLGDCRLLRGQEIADMAESIENTLFFAGEHTNTDGHFGTVHGAISTGERAAGQVLAALQD